MNSVFSLYFGLLHVFEDVCSRFEAATSCARVKRSDIHCLAVNDKNTQCKKIALSDKLPVQLCAAPVASDVSSSGCWRHARFAWRTFGVSLKFSNKNTGMHFESRRGAASSRTVTVCQYHNTAAATGKVRPCLSRVIIQLSCTGQLQSST